MAASLLDGKALARSIQDRLTTEVAESVAAGARPPGLAVVRVGEDPASEVYVRNKERVCAKLGMSSFGEHLPATTSRQDIRAKLEELNHDERVDGILLQLPLPDGLPARELLAAIDPAKDVDGFHPENSGRLLAGEPTFVPCTARGVMELLQANGLEVNGARAVVVGRSNIVGKPMALLLLAAHATVTICHSRTRDLTAVTREADILVAATGVPGWLGPEGIKPGGVVIDIGTTRVTDPELVHRVVKDPRRLEKFEEKGALLLGDVRFDAVREVAGHITPVPGGVGPLTVTMLLQNTWDSYRRRL